MAQTDSPFFEVQGLLPCPVQRKHKCSSPEHWQTLYHLLRESEAKETLSIVIMSDSELYERYEDFRMARPNDKRHAAYKAHDGYAWERGAAPRRRRSPQPARPSNVVPITEAKSAKSKKSKKGKKGKKKVKVQ